MALTETTGLPQRSLGVVLAACVVLGACAPEPQREGGKRQNPPPPTTTMPPSTTVDPTSGAELVESGVQDCDPGPGVGFDRYVIGEDWVLHEMTLTNAALGVIVADLDGDTWMDLVVPHMLEPTLVFFGGPDGVFREPEAPVVDDLTGVVGGSAADADGDGDTDLVLYRYWLPAVLAVNDGTGRFSVVTLESEDDEPTGCGGSASWADMDLDGDLDLFLGRVLFRWPPDDTGVIPVDPCDSRLYENLGDLTFADRSDMLGEDVHENRVFASGWVEVDDDPWPELYVISDLPGISPGNRLLDNEGGVLSQEGSSLDFKIAGMGLGVGDLNEDDVLDLVVPGINEVKVMVSEASLDLWVDQSHALGIVPATEEEQVSGWSGELVDIDNDTLLDLIVTFGPDDVGEFGIVEHPDQPDELYLQQEDGSFVRSAAAWGFADTSNSRGTITVDLDRNGALDIVKREFSTSVTVDLQPCREEAWMIVRLHDALPNASAIGARVRVLVGDRVLTRVVGAGSSSFASGGPPEVHVGLGAHASVDAIEVVWPDGARSRFEDIASRQVVDIRR